MPNCCGQVTPLRSAPAVSTRPRAAIGEVLGGSFLEPDRASNQNVAEAPKCFKEITSESSGSEREEHVEYPR